MVKTLHQANVNTLWEHALSDNKNHKKKPVPKDPMYIYLKHKYKKK